MKKAAQALSMVSSSQSSYSTSTSSSKGPQKLSGAAALKAAFGKGLGLKKSVAPAAPKPAAQPTKLEVYLDREKANVSYEVRHDLPKFSMKKHPIAKLKTDPPKGSKCVAASDDFVCYGLKTSDIRVIHKPTVDRGIFHGHTDGIADMKFYNSGSKYFASLSYDGTFIWRSLVHNEGEDDDADGFVTADRTLRLVMDARPSTFHFLPTSPQFVIIACGNHLALVDVHKALVMAEDKTIGKLTCATLELSTSGSSGGVQKGAAFLFESKPRHGMQITSMAVTMDPRDPAYSYVYYGTDVGHIKEVGPVCESDFTDHMFVPQCRCVNQAPKVGAGAITFIYPITHYGGYPKKVGFFGLIVGCEGGAVMKMYQAKTEMAPSQRQNALTAYEEVHELAFQMAPGHANSADTVALVTAFEDFSLAVACVSTVKGDNNIYFVKIGFDEAGYFFDFVKGYDTSDVANKESIFCMELQKIEIENRDKLLMYCVQESSVAMYQFDIYTSFLHLYDASRYTTTMQYVSTGSASTLSDGKEQAPSPSASIARTNSSQSTQGEERERDKQQVLLTPTQILKQAQEMAGKKQTHAAATANAAASGPPKIEKKHAGAPKPSKASREPSPKPQPQPQSVGNGSGALTALGNADLSALEERIVERLGGVVADGMSALDRSLAHKLKQQREENMAQMATLLKAVSHSIHRDLPLVIQKMVGNELSEQTKAIAASVKGEINGFKPALVEAYASQMQALVLDALRTKMAEAFRREMETKIVPSFERACQSMFTQMHSSLQQGLQTDAALGVGGAGSTQVGSVLSQAQALVDSLRGASLGLGLGSSDVPGSIPKKQVSLEEIEERQDPTTEIHRLLETQQYDDAFNKVLVTQNVDILNWACDCVDERQLFSTKPFPLSQSVLLSLLQQLGTQQDLKVTWITKIILSLDKTNKAYLPYMTQIVQMVHANVIALVNTGVGENNPTDLDMLQFILSQLVHELAKTK